MGSNKLTDASHSAVIFNIVACHVGLSNIILLTAIDIEYFNCKFDYNYVFSSNQTETNLTLAAQQS